MRKILVSAGLLLAIVGLPSSAAALTCPTSDGFKQYYTVDPASACVWGGGNIAKGNDDFLSNWPNLVTQPNDGIWGGDPAAGNPILTGGAWTNVEYTSSGGDGVFLDVNTTTGQWSITGALANTEYLVGLKQGTTPDWAVFLVTALSGTWDIDDKLGLSHIALYSRATTQTTGTSTSSGQAVVPEPASLLLLGTGLGSIAWRVRRRRQAAAAR